MSAGLYVPLQANFFGDDKVVLCSPLAKLVYLQGLCIAKLMEIGRASCRERV